MNLCIIMATSLEAEPFINNLDLKKYGYESFKQFMKDNIRLVISGVGKTDAAIATTYCCTKYNPSCIINLGAAGATNATYSLGTILHVRKIVEHDRPQFPFQKPHSHKPDTLKGFPITTLATGDRPIVDPKERNAVSKYANLVDMEAAAIVQTCRTFKTKCYVFKYVSDTPDHAGGAEILKNMKAYRKPFFEFVLSNVIPLLSNSAY